MGDLTNGATPPGPSGGVVVCAACATPCSGGRFCGKCGARLWECCAACSAVNAVDRRFCGACGVALAEALGALTRDIEERWSQGEALAREGRYLDAAKLLEQATFVDHTELEGLRRRFTDRREELLKRRETAYADSLEALRVVREMVAAGDLRGALKKALETPSAMRGGEFKVLCDDLAAKVSEADRLRGVVKQAVISKEYDGLLEVVTRLRELEDSPSTTALWAKLKARQSSSDEKTARRLLREALHALKKSEYRAAEAALRSMPDAKLEERHVERLVGARERVWLAMQLARARYVDEALLTLADRLVKLQAHDDKAATLRTELQKRRRAAMLQAPGQPVELGKPPQETAVGIPVALARIPEPLAEHAAKKNAPAQQLLMAYGLALQAVGRATYEVDLTPRKKSWLPPALSKGGKKPLAEGWGIDIGSHSLKAVRLTVAEAGPVTVAETVVLPIARAEEEVRHAESATRVGEGALAALQQFLTGRDLSKSAVVVGLPGPLTLGRFFYLPSVAKGKMDEAIRYELRMRIPRDPETIAHAYVTVEDKVDADSQRTWVALIAAMKEHVEERLALFKGAKPLSLAIAPNSVALVNAIKAADEKAEDTRAVVALGAKTANLVVLTQTGFWFRSLYHGADAFDAALVEKLNLTWEEAEKTRRRCTARRMHEVDAALTPGFASLIEAILRTFTQFVSEEHRQVDRLLVCGGGAYQHGLMRVMLHGE